MNEFSAKIEEIRRRARESMEKGAVTAQYRADRNTVLKMLNDSLATEIVCVLRYQRHYQMAQGMISAPIADEFLEHANEEREHANWIADRITELNGEPDYNPATLAERSNTDYVECETLEEMIRENLVAERIVIGLYSEMIRFLGNDDPTTRRLFEKILDEEEEHAEDLATLLGQMTAAESAESYDKSRKTPTAA